MSIIVDKINNTRELITNTPATDVEVALKANLASPALTGTPIAPTAGEGTNTTQVATTAFVNAEIASVALQVSSDLTPQLGGALDCNGKTINVSSYRQLADASPSVGTHTISYADGDLAYIDAAGDFTLDFSNFTVGKVCSMVLQIFDGGSYTITYGTSIYFSGGVSPELSIGSVDVFSVISDVNGDILMSRMATNVPLGA